MNILLYNPDNEVTNNFMPHLWMFLLKALTPAQHNVYLVDGNAHHMSEQELANYARANQIRLAGIGAMTRMAAKAYRMADALRAAGVPVVMGGPHVTEVPDEPLGRAGEPRHVDAIALGEADQTWPRIIADAEQGKLQEIYAPIDENGKEIKPSLDNYPEIPWDKMELEQFNLLRRIPRFASIVMERLGLSWTGLTMIPIESGRGCPYGCEFCTVTGFFGDSLRYRSNESVVKELLSLKAIEERKKCKIAVFFIDDNFAINRKRTKALLRDIIAAGAQLPWVAQISMNLLNDEELVSLIAQSGGQWIFMGLESIDPENLKSVSKGFNKPSEYKNVLELLARYGLYAITSFIFGMDGDREGVAERTLETIRSWPPGLPVFGLLTPYPATPLYTKLSAAGRLTRPTHWLDFRPFAMAHAPLGISAQQAEREVRHAWKVTYDAKTTAAAIHWLESKPVGTRLTHLFTRLLFRGIYFPQMRNREWAQVVFENRRTIARLTWQALRTYGGLPRLRRRHA